MLILTLTQCLGTARIAGNPPGGAAHPAGLAARSGSRSSKRAGRRKTRGFPKDSNYKLPLPFRNNQGRTERQNQLQVMQQEQPGRGAVLHTQTCRAIFIYLYCTHLSLHISWDEANFPSQDKLFLFNSAKSICSQDNFCYCLTQIFWKGKSSPLVLPPPRLLDCSEHSPGDAPAP